MPAPTVSQLLTTARSHEQQRRTSANRRNGKQPAPDYPQATAHAQQALDARLQAHDLDPEHTDPAWQGEDHAAMVKFLTDYIPRS